MNTSPAPQANRRGFLKTSAKAAAAAATLAALNPARFAHAAGSDAIKAGMIGCGDRNTGAASQALKADPGVRLTAMCDIFRERVFQKRDVLRALHKDRIQADDDRCFSGFDGYKRVIECSDVVLIANAAKFHPLHMKAAIEAGKHVFVEKPHGIDPYGVKMMQAACETAKEKKLCVVSGLQSRYHAGYIETIRRIHDGAIGDIVAIEENYLRAPYRVIDRRPGLTELQWQCSTQYHFVWLSGDDIVQSLVHNLDRACWVMGETAPVKCHGLGGRAAMTAPVYGDVFDHNSVTYEFENGVRMYAFCRTTTGCYDENSSIILGTKGRASILRSQIWGENKWRWEGQADPYQTEHNRLFAAIRSGEPLNNGDYMARGTLTGIMGQISCYTGKEVTWEQICGADFAYPPKPEDCRDDMEPPVKPGHDGSYPVYVPGQTRLI